MKHFSVTVKHISGYKKTFSVLAYDKDHARNIVKSKLDQKYIGELKYFVKKL